MLRSVQTLASCAACRRAPTRVAASRSSRPPRISRRIAQEVGGDKVKVEALAKGYQDPHFVEAKPSFVLKLNSADLLVVVGRELEIGWLPPLITQSRNAKIQPGGRGLSRRLADGEDPRHADRPDHARDGRRAPAGQSRTTGSIRRTAGGSPRRSRRSCREIEPGRRGLLRAARMRTSTSGWPRRRSAGRRRWRRTRA